MVQQKEPYISIINEKEIIAISFNYTETLETVYGINPSNICHIHGQRETCIELQNEKKMMPFGKNNSPLIVGFGDKQVRNRKQIQRKSLLMGLFKNTQNIIYQNKDFFEKIADSDIKEIYSLGFSFSDADMPYIRKICLELNSKGCGRKMQWFIAPYGNLWEKVREEIHFRRCIWQAGFRGKVRKMELDME